jgi:hypothetical protein
MCRIHVDTTVHHTECGFQFSLSRIFFPLVFLLFRFLLETKHQKYILHKFHLHYGHDVMVGVNIAR